MKSKGKAGPAGRRERRERREFSEEFKVEAVRLAAERRAAGGTLTQVGRELDVRPDQLRAWTKQHGRATGASIPGETVEQENRRLRREVAVLRQEQAFAKNWSCARGCAIC
jgi:transposase